MVERFNAVVDRGNFDFEVWFNDRIIPGRTWDVDESTWRFRYRYLPVTTLGKRRFRWPTLVFGKRMDVLVSLYAEPSFLAGWAIARLRGIKTAFWCEITMDRWVRRTRWKDALKRFAFARVDATLGAGQQGRQFAIRFGIPPEKAMLVPHSIDVALYSEGSAAARVHRDAIREKWGLRGTTYIYVGRLWWGKGINFLLDAFEKVQQQHSEEVSLFLVGDGPEEAELKRQCEERRIRNVVFAGFHQKPLVPGLYAASDVFVFPTLGDPYGLVVDEAMACSLPVISTSSAGEIEDRVEEGANGYIVPPEDSATLADRMLQLARNPDLRRQMGKRSSEKISGHTPERWAADLEEAVERILKN
jgi:glycosyltransferase involved in cell wall biosynthesis